MDWKYLNSTNIHTVQVACINSLNNPGHAMAPDLGCPIIRKPYNCFVAKYNTKKIRRVATFWISERVNVGVLDTVAMETVALETVVMETVVWEEC